MHWWELKMRAEIAANMYVRACLIRPTGFRTWTGTSSQATSTIVAYQVRLLHHYNEAMYFFTDSSWFKMIFCGCPLKLKTKLNNFNFASFGLAKPSWIHCPGTDIYMKTNSFLWHFDKVGRLIFTVIIIIHSFYIALFSALKQTHCAHWHVVLNEWLYPFIACIINIHRSGVLIALFGCCMAGATWNAAVSAQVLCTPFNHAPGYSVTSFKAT